MARAKTLLLFHSSEEFILTYASLRHQLFRCFFVHSEKEKRCECVNCWDTVNNTELWNNVDKNITTPNILKYFLTVTSFFLLSPQKMNKKDFSWVHEQESLLSLRLMGSQKRGRGIHTERESACSTFNIKASDSRHKVHVQNEVSGL